MKKRTKNEKNYRLNAAPTKTVKEPWICIKKKNEYIGWEKKNNNNTNKKQKQMFFFKKKLLSH